MKRANKPHYPDKISKIVVIGTSAGGLSALRDLIGQLRTDFPVPVLVVRHVSADATGNVVLDELNKLDGLKCEHAINGKPFKPGYLYLAPSDHHLMIGKDMKMLVTKGALENRYRPAFSICCRRV